ncbi:ChaC-like protein [Sistotremastrum suecicum HHB10207 ss-3]|uniref:glutathione-specific gamma-glutamylcyclotransferase n=1 Tax=Sistotremastrum suecicum HHB10207 ss-3 TaxID=1314776 RepID=A0A166AL29_9AGAM|nr:ChaC-like protein [Sistotremastrum suecicum HHB10207 ss-3]
MSQPYIVFGYGSLIFKPPPHTISQVNGFLKGYVRRFAQSSNDHRGTPENLGRVVTLISAEDWAEFSAADPFPHDDIVWGVAYTIDPAYASENGYSVHHTDVYGFENGVEKVVAPQAVVYVGRKDNHAFVGSEDLDVLAARIYTSVGPSGKNKDYLYDLADAVKKLAPESYDSHIAALVHRVRALENAEVNTTSQ